MQRALYFHDEDSLNEFLQDYKVGIKIKYEEYISTIKGETYNSEGQVQIFIENSTNGKDISGINHKAQEVIYNRNATFDVIDTNEVDGVHYILLGEVYE